MELLISMVTAIVMFVSTFLIIKRKIYSQPRSKAQLFPPGRTSGWAVISETMEFFSMGKKGTLEKFYMDRMEKYSWKMFSTCLFGTKVVVVCGPEANKFLFSNEKILVTGWLPECMTKIFPQFTASNKSSIVQGLNKMRKFISMSVIKPDVLKKYLSIMDEVAREVLSDEWDGKEAIESVMPLIKRYNIIVAGRLIYGIDDHDKIMRFGKLLNTIMAGIVSIPIDLPGTRLNGAVKASAKIKKEILEIIAQRNKEPVQTDDITTHMLTTTNGNDQLHRESLVAENLIGMALAGSDTIPTTIAMIMKYLAELPQVYDNVLKELQEVELNKPPGEILNWDDLRKMKYSWNIACEVMRLAPPCFGTFREALTDFTFDGFNIPKGTKLHWSPYSTHKNPEYFPKPEEFDPSRFDDSGPNPYTYIPFGGGPRMCPGREFAKLEILAFMYNVVRKFRWEKILPNENVIVDVPVLKIENGLPIRLYPN